MKFIKREYKLILSTLCFLIWCCHSYVLDFMIDDLELFVKNTHSIEQINNVWNCVKWKTFTLIVLILFSIISYSCRNKGAYNRLFFSIITAYLLDQYIDTVLFNSSTISYRDLIILIVSLGVHLYKQIKSYANKRF